MTAVFSNQQSNKYMDDLKIRIIQEVEIIKETTLLNVFLEIGKRLNFCISVKDDSFEQYFRTLFVKIKSRCMHL